MPKKEYRDEAHKTETLPPDTAQKRESSIREAHQWEDVLAYSESSIAPLIVSAPTSPEITVVSSPGETEAKTGAESQIVTPPYYNSAY